MNTRKQGIAWYLLLVYGVYFLYYFADMQTSANTMVKQTESRGMVHIFLIVLIGLLAVYFISRMKWFVDDGFRSSFFVLISWCALTDILVGASFWGIATHIGLLVLFYLIYYFAGHYINSQLRYKMILALEFALWCVTLWYAISAFVAFREYQADRNLDGDVVLNMAYNMLVFIPILLQLKNRVLKGASVAISVVYIVASLKRGAIIAMIAMFLVAYFAGTRKNKNEGFQINKKIASKALLIGAGIVIAMVVVNNKMGGALLGRFSLDELRDGSDRSRLYAAAWADIKTRNLLPFLIGKGSGSSLRIIGSGVHNEELEFWFSYGLIGLVLYLITMFRGIGRTRKLIKEDMPTKRMYAMGLTYLICVGVVGSALFSHMAFHVMLAMGLANSPVHTEQMRYLVDEQKS